MAKKSAKKSKKRKTPNKAKSAKPKVARKSKSDRAAASVPRVRSQKEQIAERDLEEGLEETFPGSDPVAATEPGPKE
jgi:hypothetical protein